MNWSGEGVSGFVLDLRSNPGGLLMASVEIARQWLDEGVIVSSSTVMGSVMSNGPAAVPDQGAVGGARE